MANNTDAIKEVMAKYSAGTISFDEANVELAALGADFPLVRGKNDLTEADIAATSLGKCAAEVNGFGLVEDGIGNCRVKVKVTNGIVPTDYLDMSVNILIGGKIFNIKGNKLVD